MLPKSIVLIIAGSDSSGGAGIQADIKTVTSLGCYAMTAITAVTAQNTTGVKSIIAINPKEISNQIEFTSKDIKPNAIKVGMLHSKKVISAVIRSLKKIKVNKIVLDPVMVAKGGEMLIDSQAIKDIKKKLIKKIFLITPNIPEAELNQMNDILLNKKIIKVFKSKKYRSKNTHGTGCTLSSAITANLSCGKDLIKSCELGIKYVNEAIKSNLKLGKGNGPINHLNSITLNKKFK